jgi:hypothetical protein
MVKFDLPVRAGQDPVTESSFWSCGMMDFENIGFTHTVGSLKYLTCADCEVEVLGYQDLSAPKVIYVAAERLCYDSDQAQALRQRNQGGDSLQTLLGSLSADQLQQLSPSAPQPEEQ